MTIFRQGRAWKDMQSRLFEIFKLTTYSLGIIVVANLVFSILYHQFVYTAVLNSRLPANIAEDFATDAEDPKVSFTDSFQKVKGAIEGLEKEFQKEFKENPQKVYESFYDIMLKEKPYFLFLQSLLWFVSFIGTGYLVLYKFLKIKGTDLSEELSFPVILTGLMNGFGVFIIVVVFGILLKLSGVDANPGLFPTKLFQELKSNTSLLAWSVYSIGLLTGIIEELFFRGFLLKTFIDKDYGKEGLVIISVIFGYLHFGIGTTFAVPFIIAIVGMYFGYLYVKTKNIWISIACHATYNSLGLLVAFLGGESV